MTFWERRLEDIKNAPFNQVRDRVKLHTEQYKERGFDDSETWDLYMNLAKLILPRLKRYKELAEGCIVINFPLDSMINAFDIIVLDKTSWTKEEQQIVDQGLKDFSEHFYRLWW